MRKLFYLSSIAFIFTSCIGKFADTPSGSVYSKREALSLQKVKYGEILSLREVKLVMEEDSANLGAIVGAVSGALISEEKSNAQKIGASLLGAAIGKGSTRLLGKEKALEFTIQLEKEVNPILIVQKKSKNETFKLGDKVRLISTKNGRWRVAPK